MSRLTADVRNAYQSFAQNPESMWDRFDEAAVFHISGDHPLSGDYVGLVEIRRYLTAVRAATGGRGGFSVTAVFGDASGTEILVEGTAFHGEGPYVRTIVHQLRLVDGRLVEFRDHPFDQHTEDRFWRATVPAQRDGGGRPAPVRPLAGPPAVIPPQPMTKHITRG